MSGGEGGARYGRMRTLGKTVAKKYLYQTVRLTICKPILYEAFSSTIAFLLAGNFHLHPVVLLERLPLFWG